MSIWRRSVANMKQDRRNTNHQKLGLCYTIGSNYFYDLLRVGVGEYPHVAGWNPQFTDDVSVADDHHQTGCQKKDDSLVNSENTAVTFIFTIVNGDGLFSIGERPRICPLLTKRHIVTINVWEDQRKFKEELVCLSSNLIIDDCHQKISWPS